MLNTLMNYQFIRYAVVAGLLTSIVCGIIGVIIVEKKLVMLSGGIAHTAYGGVGLGYLLGFEPLLGALGFSICAACMIGAIHRRKGASAEVLTAMLWSAGMALGVVFIALMPGYPPDLNSYLFGNILSVTRLDLYLEAVVCIVCLLFVLIFYNDWKSYLFDSEFAGIIGLKTRLLEYCLLIMTAMAVVILIRVVGIVLILALLTAPAATASFMTRNLGRRMTLSVILGMIYCAVGLLLSYYFNIPSGAAIIIISVMAYFVAYFLKKNR